MFTRRMLLTTLALAPLAACNTTPAQAQTDINLIATALQTEGPVLLSITGLNPAAQTQISGYITTAVAAAQALSGIVLAPGSAPTTFTTSVNDLLKFLATPAISALIPANIGQIISAVGALLPLVMAALGITSAPAVPATMAPTSARLILAGVHG